MIWAVITAAGVIGFVIGVIWRDRSGSKSSNTKVEHQQNDATADDARIARTVNSLPLGIVVAGPEGAIIYRNTFAQRFGSGRHSDAIVDGAVNELLAAGREAEQVLDLYGPPRHHLVLRSRPLDRKVGGTMVTIADVTEILRSQTTRRDFVANVSHELKTPVSAISVLAETLKNEDDLEVIDRLGSRLHNEAIRLGRTIDDLLELSQLESDDVSHPDDVVRVDELFTDAQARTREAAVLRGVTVRIEQSPPGLAIRGSRFQLGSALVNLIENAIKYSDTGSTVSLAAEADGGWISLEVSDSGIGIPESDHDRIFERFYRVDPARSRDSGGTGLGLSIVRHIVLNHEGRISIESREGDGSTFTLRFRPAGRAALADSN